MRNLFKIFVFILLFAVVILSCVSCNETPNDTEMTDGTEVTNAPKTELYVVPNDVEISAEGYMGFTPGEIYENKVAIDEFVDTCFEDVALPNELPLKIKAFDVFDIDKWCDVNYVNLYIDYGKAKTKLQLAVADCNSEQTEKNAQIYAECLENFKKAAKDVNDYPAKVEAQKLAELTEHFDALGVSSEIKDGLIYLTATKEQILTLADTRFVFFIVFEDGFEQPE